MLCAGLSLALPCAVASAARAETPVWDGSPRPPDAPRARIHKRSSYATQSGESPSSRRTEAPPLPPEYIEINEDGIKLGCHPSAQDHIRPLFDKVRSIRSSLAELTGGDVLRDVEVRVAAVPAVMVSLSPGPVPPDASWVAFYDHRLVVLSALSLPTQAPVDVETALTHALAHIALDEAANGAPLPPWFHEGFATYAEGTSLSRTKELIDAAMFGRFLSLDELAQGSTQAFEADLTHAEAGDFVRFLAITESSSGQSSLIRLLSLLRDGEPYDTALLKVFDAQDRGTIEARWSETRARRYAFVPVLAVLLSVVGLLFASLLGLRRARQARAQARLQARASKEKVRARPAPAPQPKKPGKPARAPTKAAAHARLAAGRAKDSAIHLPRDPDVPKIEHNGKWHTLH